MDNLKVVPITKLAKFGELNLLGKLEFPNGKCITGAGNETKFNVEMLDLYNLLVDWDISDEWENVVNKVDVSDIIAIIAIGGAVKNPGYRIVKSTRKKYMFFGPEITTETKVPYNPSHADFLVITHKRMINAKVLKPVSINTYDQVTTIKKGGIHLVNRSWDQFIKGIEDDCDGISKSAVKEGVFLFGSLDPFKYSNVKFNTELSVKWIMNPGGKISGTIS